MYQFLADLFGVVARNNPAIDGGLRALRQGVVRVAGVEARGHTSRVQGGVVLRVFGKPRDRRLVWRSL